ncbi:MAG TPA: hypothetical protein VKA86_05535 [Candidatus Krumholzibacteria bacterium]|nr:hypothetical protein [Candidatus Krumholzibacteria bacterium]
MARRFPTHVVLLPVLAACATTAPVDVDTRQDDGRIVYLDGMTTRYAVKVDELPAAKRPKHDRLINAVVAGDASMTAAASLYRCESVYTLDLVLHNHGETPLAIDRGQIKLYDRDGVPLTPLLDWADGIDHGLRAEQATIAAYEIISAEQRTDGGGAAGIQGKGDTGLGVAEPTPVTSGSASAWDTDLRLVQRTVTLPAVVTVSPDRHAPYWAYWKTEDAEFPLTATIRVGDKRMVMQFDEPPRMAR